MLVFAQPAVSHLRFVFCEAYKVTNQSADAPLKIILKPNTGAGGAVAMAAICRRGRPVLIEDLLSAGAV